MENLLEVFGYAYAQRALLASSLVGISCGVLGCFIVLRNMSLIGDALSHAILPGVVVGFLIAGHSVFAFFVGSVVAGLIAALLITWLQRNARTKEDAAIGIVFSAMFALGIIGISAITRQEGVHLDMKDFLFGNVLGIANQDLWLTGMITVYTLLSVVAFYRFFFVTTFQSVMARSAGINVNLMHYFLMLLLSFVIVASLQSVGVILVVAMLIIPASTAYLLTNKLKHMLWLAALSGVISSVSGLVLAIVFETTPGPAMTLVAAFLYVLALCFSPEKGLVVQWYIKRKRQAAMAGEDVLKAAVKQKEKGDLRLLGLAEQLAVTPAKLQQLLKPLVRKGLLTVNGPQFDLSVAGKKRAYELIRAHRLWETYLVQEMGLATDQIHSQAEAFEHRLPEKFLQEVDAQLGYPQFDPHGSPIPQKSREPLQLSKLDAGDQLMLLTDQLNDNISLRLWKLGINPNSVLLLEAKDEAVYRLQTANKSLEMDAKLAEQVLVVKVNSALSV